MESDKMYSLFYAVVVLGSLLYRILYRIKCLGEL